MLDSGLRKCEWKDESGRRDEDYFEIQVQINLQNRS